MRAGSTAATGTIEDDTLRVRIEDASAVEGQDLTFTATLNRAVPGGLTVTPSFTDGTATEGVHYTANTAPLIFTGRDAEQHTFTVSTTRHEAAEDDKAFTVNLDISNAPPLVRAGSTAATGTIEDDTLRVRIEDASAVEGQDLTFTATLNRAVPGGLTVTPSFTDGTATEGVHYTANTAPLSFAGTAGEQHTFTVSTTPDDVAEEPLKTFTVSLVISDAPPGVSGSSATGTIEDDENRPPELVRLIGNVRTWMGWIDFCDNMEENFEDPDGDPLTFTAVSEHPTIVETWIADCRGNTGVHMSWLAPGKSEITVTASDGFGDGTASDSFMVTVEHMVDRSVAENSPPGTNVGNPVTGTPAESETLTYTLSGDSRFTIDETTGQISVADGASLDYEATRSYTVTVNVTDGQDGEGNADPAIDGAVELTINVTDMAEPPARLVAPSVERSSSEPNTALDVSWTAPDSTGRPAIAGYDVRYRKEAASEWTEHPFAGTGTETTIGGLESGAAYEVQVTATNDEGTSDWSDTGTATTGQANTVPESPKPPESTNSDNHPERTAPEVAEEPQTGSDNDTNDMIHTMYAKALIPETDYWSNPVRMGLLSGSVAIYLAVLGKMALSLWRKGKIV